MANAEAKLGKSLDAIIEENRAKLGTRSSRGGGGASRGGRGGGSRASSSGGGGARVGRPAAGGGARGGRLRGIAGLSGRAASRASSQANEVVVGNTRYVKATNAPGVAGGGVSKAGGGGRRRRSGGAAGGGGGAAAFMHDDRTGMGGFADEYGIADIPAPVGGGGRRMGSRLQRGTAAGVEDRWQHDMFDPHEQAAAPPRRAGRLAGAPAAQPTRMLIANLNYTVTQEDLEELFSAAGEVLSVNLDYDRTDRLTGTGSVVFRSHKQAEKALAEFNGAKLDGKPMRLAIDESAVVLSSGKSVQLPSASRPAARASMGVPRAARGGSRGRGGGRLRSVVGGGRPTRSAQDLDAEMNDYMQE